MPLNIILEEKKGIPLYKQISDAVLEAIKSGKLPAGFKLPTVRELADEMKISRGTIKHAYEYLEQLGAIEMVQGRGSFVLGKAESDSFSRKEKAMAAIDKLFDELEELKFTPREMEIYLNLKLRELDEKYDLVKVAVVDCNPETIKLIERQLSEIEYVEIASFALSDIYEMADKLNSDYDLVLTTTTHFGQLESILKPETQLGMLAMVPDKATLVALAKLGDEEVVGIGCASSNFAGVIRTNCSEMGQWSEAMPVHFFGKADALKDFLGGKTVLILPEGYEAFTGVRERKVLRDFADEGGKVIPYNYVIDRGSFAYVNSLINRCLNEKRSL